MPPDIKFKGPSKPSNSCEMRRHISNVRRISVFKQVNSLPCAQKWAPHRHRNCQRHGQHRGFDMRGHVVGSFIGMHQIRHRCICGGWHKPVKERLQVALHVGIGVFLNEQAATGVAHE